MIRWSKYESIKEDRLKGMLTYKQRVIHLLKNNNPWYPCTDFEIESHGLIMVIPKGDRLKTWLSVTQICIPTNLSDVMLSLESYLSTSKNILRLLV